MAAAERSTLSKCIETASLIATWISLSLCLEMFGPTLLDMKYRLNTSHQQMSFALSGRSYGMFPGSIIGGVLADKFTPYCRLIVAISLDIMAVATATVPWSPTVGTMFSLYVIIGVLESIVNIAGTRIVFNIWKDKTMTPLLLIHLGYGIGSFIAPVYADPFLRETEEDDSDETVVSNLTTAYNEITTMAYGNSTPGIYNDTNSRVEFPFSISAGVAFAVSIFFYLYQARKCSSPEEDTVQNIKAKEMENEKKTLDTTSKDSDSSAIRSFIRMINPATCAGGRFSYGAQILALTFVYCGNIAGGDRMIGNYIRTYAVEEAKFTKSNASYLNVAFWVGFSSGRAVFSMIGFFVKVRKLLIMVTGGMATTGLLLLFFAGSSDIALWVLVISLGFFCAPTWPTGIAWTDYHIELTGLGMTWQMLGGSIGGIIHLNLIGYLYQSLGPIGFLYQVSALCVLQLVLSSLLTLVGAQHGSRFKHKDKEIIADEKDETSNL